MQERPCRPVINPAAWRPNGRRFGRRGGSMRPGKTPAAPSITSWRCFLTRPGASTWGTCAITPSATWWLATNGCGGSTCCTPWAGTPSACPRKTPPWPGGCTRPSGPLRISPTCAASFKPWAIAMIGPGSWPPATRNIIVGSSWSSSRCSKGGWPTNGWPRSTGAPSAPRCWPMSRWKMAAAGGATPRCT